MDSAESTRSRSQSRARPRRSRTAAHASRVSPAAPPGCARSPGQPRTLPGLAVHRSANRACLVEGPGEAVRLPARSWRGRRPTSWTRAPKQERHDRKDHQDDRRGSRRRRECERVVAVELVQPTARQVERAGVLRIQEALMGIRAHERQHDEQRERCDDEGARRHKTAVWPSRGASVTRRSQVRPRRCRSDEP